MNTVTIILVIITQLFTAIISGLLRAWYLSVASEMKYKANFWFDTKRNSTSSAEEGFQLFFLILLWELLIPFFFVNWCFKKFIEWQMKPPKVEEEEEIDNSKHLINN